MFTRAAYQLANLSPVPRELGLLDRYELIEPEIPFSHAFPNGDIISVHRDIEKTVGEISRYSLTDAETWRALMNRFLAQKSAIIASMFSPPPSFPAAAADFASQEHSSRIARTPNFRLLSVLRPCHSARSNGK